VSDYQLGHDPSPGGVTPTPTMAGRPTVAAPPPTTTTHGTPDSPAGVLTVPYGVPFYSAAVTAAGAGYAAIEYPDMGGGYTRYDVSPAALAGYARSTGSRAALATAAALRPSPVDRPFLGIGARSVPPMGGNAASLVTNGVHTTSLHPSGSGSVWATNPMHTSIGGGEAPEGVTAGGPETSPDPRANVKPWERVK
jgi:hypothetical protein